MVRGFSALDADRAAGPWRLTLSGDPRSASTCSLEPAVCDVVGFNLMESGHEAAEYVAAGLRMTRRWKLEAARDEWLKRSRKKDGSRYSNLPAAGRTEILRALRRTTLMDFLYEIRRRTNYESVDEYGSDATDAEVQASMRAFSMSLRAAYCSMKPKSPGTRGQRRSPMRQPSGRGRSNE